MVKDNFDEKIYAYALENAASYGGKAQEKAVLSHLFKDGLEKSGIKEVMPLIIEIVKKVNSMKESELKEAFSNYKKEFDELKKIKKEKKKELQELQKVKSKTKPVFRLAPYPSGALHIGNAKTYLLNALYAEKYKGKTLLVIDDTIGSKEKEIVKKAYKLIPEAFDWLGIKYKKPIYYKSDRLKIYYQYAEKIIKKEKAYVCSCPVEKLRENRKLGRACSCRVLPVKEQLKLWKKMFKAKPGEFTLRIKTSMQSPDPAFRDRVLFRIIDRSHPRVGKKYRVWPLLEFSWAIDDHLLKVTHIIRGKDLMIETNMERFIWNIFDWKEPEVIHSGLLKIQGIDLGEAKISKSKSQQEIKSGKYLGWDDPRTWSVQSLRRRGFKPEALKEFVKGIGLNQVDIIVPIDILYSINRKMIDKEADRYFFVHNPKGILIKNMPNLKSIDVPIHPEKTKLKKRKISSEFFINKDDYENFKGKEIRLIHLFNIKLKEKSKFLEDSADKSVQKLQWVSKKGNVKARILMSNGLWTEGLAEDNIKKLKPGAIIQFERFGFVRFDKFNRKDNVYEFWFGHK